MLQIERILLFTICLAFCSIASEGTFANTVDWILEDALEEEFITLEQSEIVTSDDYKDAVDCYKKGDYRHAGAILDNLLNLNLPDGRTDFISFMAAECFRKLDMKEKSVNAYWYVINRFPKSDKVPAAYFRVLQYAYEDRNSSLADTILTIFENRYKINPLYNSVLYVVGKLYFHIERYGEAGNTLLKIPRTSSRHFQGQFLAALSFVQLNKNEKALLILDNIRRNALDDDLIANVNTVMGDIYFTRGKYKTALSYYRAVRKGSSQYNYVQVKMARVYLNQEQYQKARDIARPFIGKGRKKEYFFEMASILEQVYTTKNEKVKAAQIKRLVHKQNINARLSFEVSDELVCIYDMIRSWRRIEYAALENRDNKLVKEAHKNIKRLQNLMKKCRTILYKIGAISHDDESIEVPGLAQQRYITLLRKNISTVEDSIKEVEKISEMQKEGERDSLAIKEETEKRFWLDSLRIKLAEMKREYGELKKVYLEPASEANKFGREMQAKYVDWAFIKYQDKKAELNKLNKEISLRSQQAADASPKDTVSVTEGAVDTVSLFTTIDIDKLIKSIREDRVRLVDHIEMLLDASPGSSYNSQVLFRLAELYFDESSEDFNRRLDKYEKLLEETADSAVVEFPEYDLDKTIGVYNRVIDNYPKDRLADNAMFFKGLALKKLGLEKEANDEFIKLIEIHTESEYYVEANMNVGRYFFQNPKIKDGKGYKLAEEAYRRVLHYHDHPQFVHAIYHLGWCYYMQDMYDEAIGVFKYIVEEVDLDFDLSQMEDKRLLNPLMREEAIDYIAISFDEQDDIEGAVKFLTLIGNINYAAMVFKRIGELREEVLEYDAAMKVYRRLIDEYALSSVAPDATVGLIKILESNNKHEQAMIEREQFFKCYARGSPWHSEISKRDSSRIKVVDSMTIAIGLYVADALYREAEGQKNMGLYKRAVDNYDRLVTAYPDDLTASEGRWNLAVILETKLFKKKEAYKIYISYSRFEKAEPERREQAALNAVAIAQNMLPDDSSIEPGKMEISAVKVIEAAKNYLELFPDGKSFVDVLMTMGSVYFNRKMFSNAVSTYKPIMKRGADTPKYYNAGFYISKCYFGGEKWTKAAKGFEKIWRGSPDELQKKEAYKLLLQSKFLHAKQLFSAGAFEKAAIEYRNIDRQYPGSEYGDITLFNSAEAFEKKEVWIKSCNTYFELYEKYPDSKYAPDALFNAASNYEKAEKYNKAAEMYELIVSNYPISNKAKDALFNVGFSYEKLGELEKMAEANERYTELYPEEKDVEIMLFRSAEFYYKASVYEKSMKLYRNYVSRYPKGDRSVEAFYKIGKTCLDNNDESDASMAFEQAEAQNKKLLKAGQKGNNYYAAEAAFSLGTIKQENYSALTLDVPSAVVKKKQKAKTELLSKAVKAFRRVMKYKSERMFEAGFHIGEMYEEYARSWEMQKLGLMDPIKLAIAKKDINFTCAKLMKNSFKPFKKVIELAAGIDSLGADQQKWVDTAKVRLVENNFNTGSYMLAAVAAMQKAPIPDEIKKQPLYLFQYKKQLLETIEPLKKMVRDQYLESYKKLKELGISEEAENNCLDKFGYMTFLIPNEYDKLAEEVLIAAEKLPENLNEDEKEELVFQFEDMVFELQDKALFTYEDALELAKTEKLSGTKWYSKIFERLARLSPETYGKSFYLTQLIETNSKWIVHTDSVKYWNAADPYGMGWNQVQIVSRDVGPTFTTGKPSVIWGNDDIDRIYLWKNAFLNGVPIDGTIYFACGGRYKLYLNEKLLSADTSEARELNQVDSITGIASLLKGGDNILALEVIAGDPLKRGVALVASALIDTSQRFKSTAMMPKVKMVVQAELPEETTVQSTTSSTASPDSTIKKVSYAQQFKNKGELLNAIADYQKRTKETGAKMRKERLEVQKMHIKIDAVNDRLKKVKKEIEDFEKLKGDMMREK